MSVVRVEMVHRVIAEIKDVALKVTKLTNGVEIFMEGGNYSGDSIILDNKQFAGLLNELQLMLVDGVLPIKTEVMQLSPSVRNDEDLSISLKLAKQAEPENKPKKRIEPRGPNARPTKKKPGFKRLNTKQQVNSHTKWSEEEKKEVAEFLNNKGTWLAASKKYGRTVKAIVVAAQLKRLPNVDYRAVCLTAGSPQ
jgi:hypothetical protein